MRKCRLLLIIVVFFLAVQFASSAHYITGYAADALDTESANNHVVMLWNIANGESDNLTDIIGVNGNSGYDHVYMIDCEALSTPCALGDELGVRVINTGDGYVSRQKNITVTVSGYDMVDNLTLNSPPSVSAVFPLSGYITNNQSVDVECSYSDLDSDSGYVSLFANFSGAWQFVDSQSTSGGVLTFPQILLEGVYSYYCLANDTLSEGVSTNESVNIDLTDPVILGFTLNESFFCGATNLRIECNTSDQYGISEVLVELSSPSGIINNSAAFSSGIYFLETLVDDSGDWNFTCYSEDNAGNIEASSVSSIYAHSGAPELSVGVGDLIFSNNNPIEMENVTITANVTNDGCVDGDNFLVSFYYGNRFTGSFIDDRVISIPSFSSSLVSIFFDSKIGTNNIFTYTDFSDLFSEDNELDNEINNSFEVLAWQEFYGSINATKALYVSDNFTSWGEDINLGGNVFMADSESLIDWGSLVAIGKNKTMGDSPNDFSEIDSLLGMDTLSDSVSTVYSGIVEEEFIIHNNNITEVRVVQSTDNDNFKTGILWDSSDDSNGEYDSIEQEDLVFVSKINRDVDGKYGNYDYEIKIPAKLREYDSADLSEVYFYYDLV